MSAIQPKKRTEATPSIIYDEYTEIILSSTEFILLTTPGREYTIQNKSGNPVYLAMNDDGDQLLGSVNQYLIGGMTAELSTLSNKYTWIRASVPDSIISIRPAVMKDPNGDIHVLTDLVNNLSMNFNKHKRDQDNIDHAVTKKQVGLSNIPNAISSDTASNSESVLATTKLTNIIVVAFNGHTTATGNVHGMKKQDIQLGNVDNFKTANSLDPDELLSTVDNMFLTPAGAYHIVSVATAISRTANPQMIVEAPVGNRPDGWFLGECDRPTAHLVLEGMNLKVKAGLRVSFGADYKSAISESLSEDLSVTIPSVDNTYFVYVDLNGKNQIYIANITTKEPTYGQYQESLTGSDFFNYSLCQMYDSTGAIVRRVYVGKVIVSSGIVTAVIQVPLGNKYVVPLGHQLALSARYIVDNPFMMSYVKPTAEVSYQNNFGETGWNDQIGVMANLYPSKPTSSIVVQCGQMGFLCAARESGNAFGSAFTTIQNNLRTRLVIERTVF